MSDESWLETGGEQLPVVAPETQKPADGLLPGMPTTALIAAEAAAEKRAKFVAYWGGLTEHQRVFLNTWRECRFNRNRALRVLAGTSHTSSKTTVYRWQEDPGFTYVAELLRSASVEEILSREYLAARQEDIVETLLEPKPVLHQGFATGYFEVEAGAAGKANETLLKLGGHLKDKEIDVNVGLVGPSFVIQVVQRDGSVIDATPRGVPVSLPEPDTEWLDGP